MTSAHTLRNHRDVRGARLGPSARADHHGHVDDGPLHAIGALPSISFRACEPARPCLGRARVRGPLGRACVSSEAVVSRAAQRDARWRTNRKLKVELLVAPDMRRRQRCASCLVSTSPGRTSPVLEATTTAWRGRFTPAPQ